MIGLEIIPIGTLLGLLTQEILETAFAAQDILMEKETFTQLSKNLRSICPLLEQLRCREIKDDPATMQALESLQNDVRRAKVVVDMCKNKSRFYQLIHCRSIVRVAEEVTRDIGKSLALLCLANNEVSADIHHNVVELKNQMLHAEYQASQHKLQIVNKIETGIKEHNTDQVFLNELIRDIAYAVGVHVDDSSEIRKELATFRREKEEAAERKERGEEAFMEQVIALLSRADAARSSEAIREDYRLMRSSVNSGEVLPPFATFCCPLSKKVMHDPVSVVTGQTYERASIEQWFASGQNTDPLTKAVLPNLGLKPNHKVRECIEEWEERNCCIRICNTRKKLESGERAQVKEALEELRNLCTASYKIRYWIAEEQLVVPLIGMLKTNDKGIKHDTLLTLHTIIMDNEDNKKQLVDAGGVELVVWCLVSSFRMSKLAVALLAELLQTGSSCMPCVAPLVLEKLSEGGEAIPLLVTLYNQEDVEAAAALAAEQILRRLCDRDINVVEMAKANWFAPLIERLHHGSEDSKLTMVKALGEIIELTPQNSEMLGEQGAMQPVIEMVTGNLHYKASALRALQSLVTCRSNKKRLAEAGAVPLVLDHLFSVRYPTSIRESAAAILEKLVQTDGTAWLVDINGDALDSGRTLLGLLEMQNGLSAASTLQKHVLSSLRGLISSAPPSEVRETFRDMGGVSMLLPLLERRESEVRNAVVQVLYCLASEYMHQISCYILERKLGGLFVEILNSDGAQVEVKGAAAGILAYLPQDEAGLTKELVNAGAVPILMDLLAHGNSKEKETAIGALLRFTLPSSDVELQRKLIALGIYTALKGLIYSGTQVSKLRAAVVFRNFSASTMALSKPPSLPGCFWLWRRASPLCRVHGGRCGEKTTFCLVAAEVVPDLVLLLKDRGSDAAGAAVDALSTLVLEKNEALERGAKLLHEAKAIGPILDLISHGTELSKEKALKLLKKIFKVRRLAEHYGGTARILLVNMATHGSESIGKQATKVLATLGHCESSSVY